MKRKLWIERLSFSFKERSGILLFALLVLLVLLLPDLWLKWNGSNSTRIVIADTIFSEVSSLERLNESKHNADVPANEFENTSATLFYFDPNTLDAAGWKNLGVPTRSVTTIIRYREKGGRFKRAADIHRIYGLSPAMADKLEPYVKIASAETSDSRKDFVPGNAKPFVRELKPSLKIIDINMADSIEWESLPGIGATLTHRILQFRTNLGGFYSVDQLREVYGLQDSTFRKISDRLVCNGDFQPIDINNASLELLSRHPYIKRKAARILVAWRQQHGTILDPEQLILCGALDTNNLRKLSPYLRKEK